MAKRTLPWRLLTLTLLVALLVVAGDAGATTGPTRVFLPLVGERQPQPLTAELRLTGYVGPLATQGDLIYLAAGVGLEIHAVGAGGLTLLGTLPLPVSPAQTAALVPVGSLLYVAAGFGQVDWLPSGPSLFVVDIADPARPRLLGATPFELAQRVGRRFCGAAAGDRWFSFSTDSELLIFDRTDPTRPRPLHNLTARGCGLSGYGPYLYRSNAPILDLRDPQNPRPLGADLPFSADNGFSVVGNTLYILTPELTLIGEQRCYNNRLQSYSLAEPQAPAPAGFVVFPVLDGSGAVARCASFTITTAGPGRIVLRTGSLTAIVATDDPLRPVAAQSMLEPGAFGTGAMLGTTLLLRTAGQLLLFDTTDLSRPTRTGAYDPVLPPFLRHAHAAGATYTLLGGSGDASENLFRESIVLLDSANPLQPRIIGPAQLLDENSYPVAAAVNGDALYTLEYRSGDGVLRIYTGVQAGRLQPAGSLPFAGQVFDIAIAGQLAYVATASGIQIVAIADPEQPVTVGSLPLNWAHPLLVRDGRLITRAGDISRDEITYSLADPLRPVEIGRIPVTGEWLSFPATGPLIYALGRRTCTVNPRCASDIALDSFQRGSDGALTQRGSLILATSYYPPTDGPLEITLGNGFAVYSLAFPGRLAVIDLRNPDRPALFAQDTTWGNPYDHALHGRTIVTVYNGLGLTLSTVPAALP